MLVIKVTSPILFLYYKGVILVVKPEGTINLFRMFGTNWKFNGDNVIKNALKL